MSRILEPAWSLTDLLDHRPSYVPVLHSLWVHYLCVDRLALSLKSAEKLLAAGAAASDDSLEIVGYRAVVGSYYWLGDFMPRVAREMPCRRCTILGVIGISPSSPTPTR